MPRRTSDPMMVPQKETRLGNMREDADTVRLPPRCGKRPRKSNDYSGLMAQTTGFIHSVENTGETREIEEIKIFY